MGVLFALLITTGCFGGKTAFYLVALNDNGKSGELVECEKNKDSVVAIQGESLLINNDIKGKIESSLRQIFELKEQEYKGYKNPLAKSELKIESIEVSEEKNGTVVVDLKGKFVFSEKCDRPRIKGQIKETIRNAVGSRPFIIKMLGNMREFEKAFEGTEEIYEPTKIEITP